MAKEMKIYTRGGDQGMTSLVSGARVSKANAQLDAYGSVDELNSLLGVLRTQTDIPYLESVQMNLFNIGSILASDTDELRKQMPPITEDHIRAMEQEIDKMTEGLPELKNFILPGGSSAASYAHMARSTCRRVERECLRYFQATDLSLPLILTYLNRLSDYFFVLARHLNHSAQVNEVLWKPEGT